MKFNKIITIIIVVFSFFVISNVSALTTNEENALSNLLTYYDSNYSYCTFQYKSNIQKMYCFSSIPTLSSCGTYQCYASDFGDSYYIIRSNGNHSVTNSSYTYISDLDEYSNYANFEHSLFTYITIGTPTLYTITFNPPSNTVITVKDSNNNEVTATSQYIYELESGTYTYSASNSLYNNITNISFTVSEDTTINVTMTSRLNPQPVRSIYTQYIKIKDYLNQKYFVSIQIYNYNIVCK